jgi:ABC-type uncharacterized transport system substrate-binding protein
MIKRTFVFTLCATLFAPCFSVEAQRTKKIPLIGVLSPGSREESQYVEVGCVMSYAASDSDRWRRAAYYVDKILKGTRPADLPVEQPTRFEFVINLKTAKQIGVTMPQSVLFRADKVIK